MFRQISRPIAAVLLLMIAGTASAQVSLIGGTYSQNFDTLSNTAASSTLPTGWLLSETGASANNNGLYAVGTGSGNAGDSYSLGAAAATDRAYGMLRSGTLNATIGACFTNNTGAALTSISVAYLGEQWRLGATGRNDRIDFQISTDATSLTTGTWVDNNALDFVAPIGAGTAGPLNGNLAVNRIAVSATIGSLSISNTAAFCIRWQDFDAAGADDALSVDDFSITAGVVSPVPNLSINDVIVTEGNAGTTIASFTVSLSLPAPVGGVTFDISTADSSATIADNDYVLRSLSAQTIPAGGNSYTFDVTINGDTTVETTQTYFVNVSNISSANATDTQGLGTITNDDVVLTQIHAIQGSGNASPLVGSSVTTRGVVTGIRNTGFFVQTADADKDADPATSQGIFVFTSGAPTVASGNLVLVTGNIVEFFQLTQITSPIISLLSSGNPLPAAINLTTADGALPSPERYESMRVVPNLTVVAPAGGNENEPNATATSTGNFHGVLPGVARPFREPGVSVLDTFVPAPSVTRFDANLELIVVQSRGLGGLAMNPNAGDVLTGVTGILDFGFGFYKFYPDNGQTFTSTVTPTAASNALPEEFTVAGFNLFRFFDTINDPANSSDPVLTNIALNNRLGKTAEAICSYLKTPDIIGVVEVENIGVLTQLADTINNGQVATGNAVPSCNTAPAYVPYLVEGNDVGGIDVGFLISSKIVGGTTPRVQVLEVVQENEGEQFVNPDSSTSTLNDRPTLRLQAVIHHANGAAYPVTVMINHLRSLSGVNDTAVGSNGWATNGDRIRNKRLKQAESLARLVNARQVANPNEKIILLGDFNAFEFNDGFTDSMGIITGQEVPAAQVTLHSGFVVGTPLTTLTTVDPANQRYSFSFDGNAQSLDHAVVNEALLMQDGVRSEHARINADFAVINYGVYGGLPTRVSDHDPVLVYVKPRAFVDLDLGIAVSNPDASINGGNTTTFTVIGNNLNATLNADNASITLVFDAAINSVSVVAATGWTCAAPVLAAASTTVTCSTLSFAALAQASFTVTATLPQNYPGGVLTLSAAISADQGDAASANNIGSDAVTIISQTANVATRVRGPATTIVGNKARIIVTFNNYGPIAAQNASAAIITNAASSTFQISTPTGWACNLDPNYQKARYLCSRSTGSPLLVGDRGEVVLTFSPPASMASANLIIGTGISSDTPDTNINNNQGSYSLFINVMPGTGLPSIPLN